MNEAIKCFPPLHFYNTEVIVDCKTLISHQIINQQDVINKYFNNYI